MSTKAALLDKPPGDLEPANGNRTGRNVNGVAETYAVDSGDKLNSVTWAGGSKTYGYDAAGRTTSVTTGSGTTTLSYDYENRVTGITYPSGASNSFTYNGLDTRVGKTDSAGTKAFMRDGADVTSPVLSDSAATYTPGVSERRSGVSKFYASDRLGTNSLETSSAQAVSATKVYDAFGNLKASTGSSASPFGFVGKLGYQEDSDSGLKLLGHRYYDASTGRFLTRDPKKDGRNWYGYVDNRPTCGVDPEGHEVVIAAVAQGGPADYGTGFQSTIHPWAPVYYINGPKGLNKLITLMDENDYLIIVGHGSSVGPTLPGGENWGQGWASQIKRHGKLEA